VYPNYSETVIRETLLPGICDFICGILSTPSPYYPPSRLLSAWYLVFLLILLIDVTDDPHLNDGKPPTTGANVWLVLAQLHISQQEKRLGIKLIDDSFHEIGWITECNIRPLRVLLDNHYILHGTITTTESFQWHEKNCIRGSINFIARLYDPFILEASDDDF
jgi:hypothetical protein